MKKLLSVFSIVLCAFALTVNADVANSDLAKRVEVETNDYIQKINTLRGQPLIDIADLISGSGLNDSKLYAAVEVKLNALEGEHTADPKNKLVAEELNAVMRALGSMGTKALTTVDRILNTSTSRGVRERAVRLQPKLGWYEQRDVIMQKTDSYAPGQDLMTYRFINLIVSDDPSNGRWAAEEIVRRNGAEPIVYRKMAEVLEKQYLDIKSDVHLDELAWFSKLLSRYDGANSKEILTTIKNNPATNKKLVKYISI